MKKPGRRAPSRLLTDTFREIARTRSRFISIMVLSALAVCFLAGLRATAPDMKLSADRYFDSRSLMDLRIVSTLGLTEEDIEALSAQPGVALARGAYTIDAILPWGDNDYIIKVLSLSDGVNLPALKEGRMPQGADECLAEPRLLVESGLSIGDQITLNTGTGDYENALVGDTFTIVGAADTPLYIGVERGSSTLGTGKVSAYLLLPQEAFDMDSYTDAYLLMEGTAGLETYSDEYEDRMEGYTAALEALGEVRAPLRREGILEEANEKLSDAQGELDEARAEAEAELSDAEAELSDARQELDEGWNEYYDGLEEYNDGLQEFHEEIAKAEAEIADGERELADALAELEDGRRELADARAELDEGWEEYFVNYADYTQGLRDYEEGLKEYEEGKKEYEDGLKEYEEGLEEYEAGRWELSAALAALNEQEAVYADSLEQFNTLLDTICGTIARQTGMTYTREQLLAALKLEAAGPAPGPGEGEGEGGETTDPDPGQGEESGGGTTGPGEGEENGSGTPDPGTGTEPAGTEAAALALTAVPLTEGDGSGLPGTGEGERNGGGTPDPDPGEGEGGDPGTGSGDVRVTDIVNQILTGTITQLEDGIAAAREKLDDLKGQLAAIQALPGQIEQLKAAIAAETDETKKTELEQQLAGLEGELAAGQEKLPELEAGIAQLETQIKSLEAQKAAIPADSAALLSAQAQLEGGRAALDSGWADYRWGRARLREAREELDEAREQLDEAAREIESGKLEMMTGKYQLDDARFQLEDGLRELQDGERDYADGLAELEDGEKEYADGLVELEDGRATLEKERADGEAELHDAAVELDDALVELRDGEDEYEEGYQEYLDGKAEAEEKIADAQEELDKARRDVESIEECTWYVLDRNTNAGYVSYSMDADRMGNLASVFPLIFFLVAALVCLTTMTRMVEEQRVTIGGLKALGYSKGAIAVKYVGYGFLASALGSLAGLAVGLSLLPWIICTAWGIIYDTGDIYYSLEPATSLFAWGAAVGTVTLSALGACFSALAAVPAQLMRPKAPPMGRRILLERVGPVWRRLSFNYKITLRNLFRYQKRFWMTVVGIGGCAALIVTAFGLRDSILDIMDTQYEEIYRYTAQVGLVDKVTAGELREVEQVLEGSGLVTNYAPCRSETVTARTDAYSVDATLQTTGSQQELEEFVNLRHRTSSDPVVLPDDGVVLTEKLAKLLDVEPGDTITLEGDETVTVRVADVTEHYIQHSVYITDAYYQAVFGQAPEDNVVLADYDPEAEGAQELASDLVALDGVTTVSLNEDTRRTFTSSLESVDYAVVLIIVCAAALAFVVLYNLTNINITERMRELATLKVLGFYDRELSAYIYRENVILTVFGVGLGMLMGKALHQWLILTVEIDLLMFGRVLRWESYAWAVALTVVFSLLVNLAAHRKLKRLDMVESLKTVE